MSCFPHIHIRFVRELTGGQSVRFININYYFVCGNTERRPWMTSTTNWVTDGNVI